MTDEDHLLILSAKHGLIRGTTVIEPYEARFREDGRGAGTVGIPTIVSQARDLGLYSAPQPLICVASQIYINVLARAWLRAYNPFFDGLTDRQPGYQKQLMNASAGRIPT